MRVPAPCRRRPRGVPARWTPGVLLLAVTPVAHGDDAAVLDPVVVTATRHEQRSFDVPASVDVVDRAAIRDGQPAINLSESLPRVPGVFAANRNNYAQDLQLSIRGFGARATFGVRGVRLYQDFIPLTMPDGQGQTGSVSLLSAQRIEVLRGPFSTLYGNASGGVVAIFTEAPPVAPTAGASVSVGSFGTSIAGVSAGGTAGGVGFVVAANRFDTEGYREHSAATRNLANAKVVFAANEATRVTIIASAQHQPDAQDPLGLTQAQVDADPRQADPVTTLFDTRKSVDQVQGGVAIEHRFTPATRGRVTAYAGSRQVEQFLAFTGAAATSSGGVVDLDRDYGGIGARLVWTRALAGGPLTVTAGADGDRMREQRRGFVNDFGVAGALRRDEIDTVDSADAYLEAQWHALPIVTATLGVRTSVVRFAVDDRYVTAQSPDDSGSRRYVNTSPVAGVVLHLRDDLNAYASYGRGFETPTFAELAYRPSGSGVNFDLAPATSSAVEAGVKWQMASTQRATLAAFHTRTEEEIVVDTATGGRTTYRNASATRRRGVEAAWDVAHAEEGIEAHAAFTWLDATFSQAFVAGSPPVLVPAGARLPGVPAQQAYAALRWTPPAGHGFTLGAEAQYVGRVQANDRNTAAAPGYTTGNVWAGVQRTLGPLRLTAYARVNNVANAAVIGSVIVNDTNARYFEPAPGRNFFLGLEANIAMP